MYGNYTCLKNRYHPPFSDVLSFLKEKIKNNQNNFSLDSLSLFKSISLSQPQNETLKETIEDDQMMVQGSFIRSSSELEISFTSEDNKLHDSEGNFTVIEPRESLRKNSGVEKLIICESQFLDTSDDFVILEKGDCSPFTEAEWECIAKSGNIGKYTYSRISLSLQQGIPYHL